MEIRGTTLGAAPPGGDRFTRIRGIRDKYGVPPILDEVMRGMGRIGHLFACDADGEAPDILCVAKGLGAGYQPIGAMPCTKDVHDAIAAGSGFFQHGHTYPGHPVATAAGLATVREILERDPTTRVRTLGRHFHARLRARFAELHARLRARFAEHPHVGDVRGRGLFRGLEFVADRETKAPFDPSLEVAGRLKKAAFAEGLICYPMPGARDGRRGDHVLPAPPFIADEEEFDHALDALQRAIDKTTRDAASGAWAAGRDRNVPSTDRRRAVSAGSAPFIAPPNVIDAPAARNHRPRRGFSDRPTMRAPRSVPRNKTRRTSHHTAIRCGSSTSSASPISPCTSSRMIFSVISER